jgi:hypothetical protein
MKKLLVEFLSLIVEAKPKSKAAQAAEKLGLEKKPGFGVYGKPDSDVVTHVTDRETGELVPKGSATQPQGQEPSQPAPVAGAPKQRGKRAAQPKQSAQPQAQPQAQTTPDGKFIDPPKTPGGAELVQKITPEKMKQVNDDFVKPDIEETTPKTNEMRPVDLEQYVQMDMPEGYSDQDYYSPTRKKSTAVRKNPFLFDDAHKQLLLSSGVPLKYIKFIERCVNTKVASNGTKPPVTELIDQGGAGKIPSQFGEVVSMIMIALPPDKREQFADLLNEQIKQSIQELGDVIAGNKADYKKTGESKGESWVDAAVSHASAFGAIADEEYGAGNWSVEGVSWDIARDITALGLDPAHKGFSTDIIIRIKPKDRPISEAVRVSLKKDERVFFFNGGTNDIGNFAMNYASPEDRKLWKTISELLTAATAGDKEAKQKLADMGYTSATAKATKKRLFEETMAKLPPNVKKKVMSVLTFNERQTASAVNLAKSINSTEKLTTMQLKATMYNLYGDNEEDIAYATQAYKLITSLKEPITEASIKAAMKAAGMEAQTDRICKMIVYASEVLSQTDSEIEKQRDMHMSLADKSGNDFMEVVVQSPELLGGLMSKIEEAFPINVVMNGTEVMAIDGIKVTSKTLQTVFGVTSYDQLKQGLRVIKKNGKSYLVYDMTGSSEPIPIGIVQTRQKGRGYQGSIGLEIACAEEFAAKLTEANKTNGDTSPSNELKYNKFRSKQQKRSTKKEKQTPK